MLNAQRPEPAWHDPDGKLEVFRIFRSIQGEGPFSGRPAVFVRLAGCNMACSFCDTDYTSVRQKLRAREVVSHIYQCGGLSTDLIVFTGGEPLRQNIAPVVEMLLTAGMEVQIETNGTVYLPLPYDRITVVCSPKTTTIDPTMSKVIRYWKYVLQSGQLYGGDGLTLGLARPSRSDSEIFVQPMDEKDETKNRENMVVAVNACLKFGYRLSLQIHKLIGVE